MLRVPLKQKLKHLNFDDNINPNQTKKPMVMCAHTHTHTHIHTHRNTNMHTCPCVYAYKLVKTFGQITFNIHIFWLNKQLVSGNMDSETVIQRRKSYIHQHIHFILLYNNKILAAIQMANNWKCKFYWLCSVYILPAIK